MSYGLPKSVEINGKEFAIRYDYRVILDIFEAMNDPDSSEEDRALDVLQIPWSQNHRVSARRRL